MCMFLTIQIQLINYNSIYNIICSWPINQESPKNSTDGSQYLYTVVYSKVHQYQPVYHQCPHAYQILYFYLHKIQDSFFPTYLDIASEKQKLEKYILFVYRMIINNTKIKAMIYVINSLHKGYCYVNIHSVIYTWLIDI